MKVVAICTKCLLKSTNIMFLRVFRDVSGQLLLKKDILGTFGPKKGD